ncbi:MAG: Lrp/AsnC family transcriptional regulator [Alphaproteobacteria bacterium]|nr:Lrp/AsnC family transcriptional regulator [Alphaproteobacteria bacterium]
MVYRLDDIDYKILYLLQRDASLSVADVALRVGLSPTPCWKRIKKMEEEKILLGSVMLVDPKRVDCPLVTFVLIKTNDHSDEWAKSFIKVVRSFPEVVSIYRITGEFDYMVMVMVKDVAAYDDLYRRLVKTIDVKLFDVTSIFALEILKRTTVLPMPIQDAEFLEKSKQLQSIGADIFEQHEVLEYIHSDSKSKLA